MKTGQRLPHWLCQLTVQAAMVSVVALGLPGTVGAADVTVDYDAPGGPLMNSFNLSRSMVPSKHLEVRRAATPRSAPFTAVAALAALTFVSSAPALAGDPAFGWGGNDGGGFGDCNSNTFCGQTGIDGDRYILSPAAISALSDVVALGTGTFHSLAVRRDESVWAWGNNGSGQLGSGGSAGAFSVSPVQVPGVSNATAVAGGFHHSLALRSDGSVWVWGSGYIGTGEPYASFSPPVQIPDLFDIISIAAGEHSSYAVRADGTLWSWGFNAGGVLGDGTRDTRPSPVQVLGLGGVVAAASHFAHALALMSDGTVWAWGSNTNGQLGDGTITERTSPVQVVGLSEVVAIGVGGFHSIALKSDGTVWAWGWNPDGLLGIGSADLTQTVPAQVTGLADVVEIAAGGFHSLAKKSDGTLWSWGWNGSGQLGLGTQTSAESTPMLVGGLDPLGPFAAGRVHSLAANADTTPDAFSFASQPSVDPGVQTTSQAVTITGTNTGAPVSVSGGEYSISCNGTFTTATGTIQPNQTVCVRHTASGAFNTSTTTTLTIGGVDGTFTSTTRAAPPPNQGGGGGGGGGAIGFTTLLPLLMLLWRRVGH